MRVIQQILGRQFQFGGEKPQGWLPPGAAVPLPTPTYHVTMDLLIVEQDEGFLLMGQLHNPEMEARLRAGGFLSDWDSWHGSVRAAESEALLHFDVMPGEWQKLSEGD